MYDISLISDVVKIKWFNYTALEAVLSVLSLSWRWMTSAEIVFEVLVNEAKMVKSKRKPTNVINT